MQQSHGLFAIAKLILVYFYSVAKLYTRTVHADCSDGDIAGTVTQRDKFISIYNNDHCVKTTNTHAHTNTHHRTDTN